MKNVLYKPAFAIVAIVAFTLVSFSAYGSHAGYHYQASSDSYCNAAKKITPYSVQTKKKATYEGDCETSYISILYNDKKDYQLACQGIKKAEDFLTQNLDHSDVFQPLRIVFGAAEDFVDEKVTRILKSAFAIYIPSNSSIASRPWKVIKNQKYVAVDFSEDLFSSIIAHELTHHFHQNQIRNSSWDCSTTNKAISNIKRMKEIAKENIELFKLQIPNKVTQGHLLSLQESLQQLKPDYNFLLERDFRTNILTVKFTLLSLKQRPALRPVTQSPAFKEMEQIISGYRLEMDQASAEFFATIIEFETMTKSSREAFLDGVTKQIQEQRRERFKNTLDSLEGKEKAKKLKSIEHIELDFSYVSEFMHAMSPKLFQLASYQVYLKNPELLEKIFNGGMISQNYATHGAP